jgi:hypothetical protein
MSLAHNTTPTSSSNAIGNCYGVNMQVAQEKFYSAYDDKENWFGRYKVTYEGIEDSNGNLGMKVQCYYKAHGTENYVALGNELELWGARIALGIQARSRFSDGSANTSADDSSSTVKGYSVSSVMIADAKITQRTTVSSEETVLENLLDRAEAIVTTAQSKKFNISVTASVNIVQTQS